MFGRKPPPPPVVIAQPPQGNPMEKRDSGGLFGADGTMKGLAELYGDRPWQRRTFGTPERTRAVGMMEAYEVCFGIPNLIDAARKTSHAWAAENGHDNDVLVRAVGAAKGQPPPAQQPGGFLFR